MKPLQSAILAAALFAATAGVAMACLAGVPRHRLDPTMVGVDATRPSRPHVALTQIVRGRGPVSLGNGISRASSLDDLGMLTINITEMADDQAAPGAMGVRIVSTDTLSGLGRHIDPLGDVQPRYSSETESWQLTMSWVDGATDTQEAISLRLLFYAIDSAGNVSTDADTLELVDPGRQ